MSTIAQTRLAAEGHWWVDHESLMDYEMSRPVPLAAIKARKKCKTDCSGSVYGIWHGLGFPDPTGGEYTDQDIVFTGTLLNANERVASIAALQIGDLVIFGTTESTHHVCFVLAPGADPLLFSHGQDRGPIKISLSDEREWHKDNGHPVMSLRRTELPRDVVKAPVWVIVNGAGKRIGRTAHPAKWAQAHPKAFRTYGQLRFLRR
jgi:hypothetical protein